MRPSIETRTLRYFIKEQLRWWNIHYGRYATSWDLQIGRLWLSLRFPYYWLYGRKPIRDERTWFFNWPGFIRITEKDD